MTNEGKHDMKATNDKKTLQRVAIIEGLARYEVLHEQFRRDMRELGQFEGRHGFGYEDEFTDEDYREFMEDAEYKRYWRRYIDSMTAMLEAVRDTAAEIARFTGGMVDEDTARRMVQDDERRERVMALALL